MFLCKNDTKMYKIHVFSKKHVYLHIFIHGTCINVYIHTAKAGIYLYKINVYMYKKGVFYVKTWF
jgi:hypothetical protein